LIGGVWMVGLAFNSQEGPCASMRQSG